MPAFSQKEKWSPAIETIAFTLSHFFNTRSVVALTEGLFPGKTNEFISVWRSRQFEYTWLRGISKQYKDFRAATEDALQYAAAH